MKKRRFDDLRARAAEGRAEDALLREFLLEFDLLTAELISANKAVTTLTEENRRLEGLLGRGGVAPRRTPTPRPPRESFVELRMESPALKQFTEEMNELRARLELKSKK